MSADRKKWALPTAVAAVVCLFVLLKAAQHRGILPDLLAPQPDQTAAGDAPTDDLLCGPKSLHIALNRLGFPIGLKEIVNECTVTDRGVAMRDLIRVAEGRGFDASVSRIDWTQLREAKTTAVLFVRTGHFVAVDSREVAGGDNAGKVRLYDPGYMAKWWSREDLGKIWSGETLVVREKAPVKREGPAIRWETCWQDIGVRRPTDDAEYEIEFVNVGTEPLSVEPAGTSCRCTVPELEKSTYAPGERGVIRATVQLKGKRAKFTENLIVNTNDPLTPHSKLWVCGGVHTRRIVSVDTLYFGDVVQGQRYSQRVVIHDPGSGNLDVRKVTSATRAVDEDSVGIHELKFRRIEPDSELIGERGRFPITAGDYLVDVVLALEPESPTGRLRETVAVETGLAGELSTVEFDVDAFVVADVQVRPKAVLLVADESSRATGTVRLKSMSQKSLRINEIVVDETYPLQVEHSAANDDGEILVTVSCVAGSLSESFVETSLECRFRDGAPVSIPVLIKRAGTL